MQAPLADFVTSVLSGAITNSASSATIGTGLNIPASDGVLQLDYDSTLAVGVDNGPETILYTAYDSATGALSGVTRGAAGTTAVAHDNGHSVGCGVSSLYFSIDPSWVAAGETWTRASATTFTITGDKTTKYAVGDKIKLTQTTVKYFYIIGVSYSSPNTTVTVTAGSDYTLASATITSPYYSKMSSPVGFPSWFNYTPTYAGAGTMTFTSVTTLIAKFKLDGKALSMVVGCNGTTGGTASDSITITTPIALSVATDDTYGGGCRITQSAHIAGNWKYKSSGTNLEIRRYDGGNYSLASGTRIAINLTADIA